MTTERIPALFLATAAACLVAGVCLGIGMGIARDFQLAPVHAHVNLVGWTSLSVMGLVYRAFAEMLARRVLAWVQFALSAGSALVFPFGIWLAIAHEQPAVAIGAALCWLAGALLFLGQLLVLAFRGGEARSVPHHASMMAAE